MSTTQAAIDAAKTTIVNRAFLRYPAIRPVLIRLLVEYGKEGDTVQRDAARYLIQQAWQAVNGASPVGIHWFRDWIFTAVSCADDATPGVAKADVYDAMEIEVT